MRRLFILACATSILLSCSTSSKVGSTTILEPEKDYLTFDGIPTFESNLVWSQDGRYEAFTDMIKFKGKWYISFRDSYSHVWEEDGTAQGHIIVIASDDGASWEKVSELSEPGIDLRDPKMSITADGRLMLLMGGSKYGNIAVTKECFERLSRVSFSSDGKTFTAPVRIQLDNETGQDWLWQVNWARRKGYGFIKVGQFTLVSTTDGVRYRTVREFDNELMAGDETCVRFLPDGTMLTLSRRDKSKGESSWWGVSKPPYKDWSFKGIPMSLGGPCFIIVDNSFCIIGTRWRKTGQMVILKGDLEGNVTPACILESKGGGDCSYPGMVIEGNELWVSYYSRHEGSKPSIYLSKIPLDFFDSLK